jgi:hypothetical protein
MDPVTSTITLGIGLVLGVVADRLTYRREKQRDRELLAREAARLLAPAVRRLQGLARESTPGGARHPRAWSEAMASFVEAYELTGHRLPPSWRHLKHSVRGAVGEFAGGVAVSDVDTRLVDYPLPEHSEEWRAAADDYLGYACGALQRWGDDSSASLKLLGFDDWWRQRGP